MFVRFIEASLVNMPSSCISSSLKDTSSVSAVVPKSTESITAGIPAPPAIAKEVLGLFKTTSTAFPPKDVGA